MAGPFHHKALYRGPEALAKLASLRLVLCGAGAVGSNLADNLTRHGEPGSASSITTAWNNTISPRKSTANQRSASGRSSRCAIICSGRVAWKLSRSARN